MKDLACLKMECCSPNWRPANYSRLEQLLVDNLVGQHIAQDMILRAVRGHQRNKSPSKPLVLSFHGWTGSGKNFISQFIADSFYRLGQDSQFVHLFIATLHFSDPRQAGIYKVMVMATQNYTNTYKFLRTRSELGYLAMCLRVIIISSYLMKLTKCPLEFWTV